MDVKKKVAVAPLKPVKSREDVLVVTVVGACALSSASVRRAAVCMLKEAGIKCGELSVVFLTDRKMRMLNCKALGHDHVTDVVTFNLLIRENRDTLGFQKRKPNVSRFSHQLLDGEIYVCPAEARRNAARFDETFERELLRYVAHGILHLLGYDDVTDIERDIMHKKEDHLLQCVSPREEKSYGDHL